MMAGLVDKNKRELYCGATIISQSYALTAAHCLIDKQPNSIGLLVGEHDTSRGRIPNFLSFESRTFFSLGSDTNSTVLILIDRIIVHKNYDSVTQKNDIGLVHVNSPITFNQRVGPACLPFVNYKQSFAGETVDVLGMSVNYFLRGILFTIFFSRLGVNRFRWC